MDTRFGPRTYRKEESNGSYTPSALPGPGCRCVGGGCDTVRLPVHPQGSWVRVGLYTTVEEGGSEVLDARPIPVQ